jgi:hypothetical protein
MRAEHVDTQLSERHSAVWIVTVSWIPAFAVVLGWFDDDRIGTVGVFAVVLTQLGSGLLSQLGRGLTGFNFHPTATYTLPSL